MDSFKQLARGALRRMGVDVRLVRAHHVDAFGDQVRLLRGRPVETIFDVGAFDGSSAARYRELFPAARVYAFEPSETSYTRLADRAERSGGMIVPVRAAVGAEAGTADLHINESAKTNSLLPTDPAAARLFDSGEMRPVGQASVPVVTLDGFCDERRIERIDLLKMDIQGFELQALRGARRLLERRAIRLIYAEVLFARLYSGQAFYHDIAAHLAGMGYELYGLYSMIRIPGGALGWADAIFRSPS
jgi:FkbM family methyltransferase